MNNIINLKILNNYKVHANNQISDITLILEHLSKLTGEHVDMLVSMLYKYDGYSLSTLKVNILKDIIRYLKVDLGYYNLSTSLNKPALVQSIELIVLPLLASSLASSSTAAAAASETSSLSVSSSSLTTTIATISKKSAAMALSSTSKSNIIKSPSCMQPSSLPLSVPSSFINGTHSDAIPHTSSNNNSSSSNDNNNNSSNFQDSTYHSNDMKTTSHAHTAPSTTAALTSTNKSQQIKKKNIQIYPSIVDTIEKRNVYDELMNYPGITSQEIIEEFECLLNINNSDSSSSSSSSDYDKKALDADLILMNIISKRQLAEELLASAAFDISSQQYDLLVEQENKDYDDAVRESEKERDVIAVRDVMFIYVLF